MIALVNRLRQQGWQTDMRSVFADPTLAQLATAIDGGRAADHCAAQSDRTRLRNDHARAASAAYFGAARDRCDRRDRARRGAKRAGHLPACALQEGILFHSVMSADADAYVTPALWPSTAARPSIGSSPRCNR